MGRPETIEPLALAAKGRILEGRLPLDSLPRLAALLAEDTTLAEVEYSLEFGRDEGGTPCVLGSVKATLPLICQRCMEAMEYPVSTHTRLGIVTSQKAAEQLADRYDPLLVPATGLGTGLEDDESEITLAAIVEDELILALPQVAMHRPEDCPQGDAFVAKANAEGEEDVSTTKRENPFAVLSQLKTTQSESND